MLDEKKLAASINIELFPSQKGVKSPLVPTFWSIVEYTIRSKKTKKDQMFIAGGLCFFKGTSSALLCRISISNKEAQNKFEKTLERIHSHINNSHIALRWVVLADGSVFVKRSQDMTFWTMKPEDGASAYWVRLMMPDVDDPETASLREPEWGKAYKTMKSIESLTVEKWKALRREQVKRLKESGEWDKAKKDKKARRIAERTNRKMKVCDQTRTVIKELEQYLKDIQNGKATREQVGDLYREMSKLSSMNKNIKTLFPKK